MLTLCYDDSTACWDDTCVHYLPRARKSVLHELAHGWLHAAVDDATEQRFIEHVGLEVWNDQTAVWDQRAIEHAAETVAWGLMDREVSLPRMGNPSVEQLVTGFEILTAIDPLPRTDTYTPPLP